MELPEVLSFSPPPPSGCSPKEDAAFAVLRDTFPDALPQPFQRVDAGLAFPVIEHFGKATDDSTIGISVLMFETEKFA
jgi:hypothetical protein